MKIALIYRLRLGDILRCLPLAKGFADDGHEVVFVCNPEYHDIFACVPHCKPVADLPKGCDKVLNLQIWPDKYAAYRASKMRWAEFALGDAFAKGGYDLIPCLNVIEPEHDYGLPEKYDLVSPVNLSNGGVQPNVIHKRSSNDVPVYILAGPNEMVCDNHIYARKLSDLPWLIANAQNFTAVNSAPSVIASAVRGSYYHIAGTVFNGQDDYRTANQIRIEPMTIGDN
jgi:UDP:flavonoid glycosyltransferase YjiC (YdhE family)